MASERTSHLTPFLTQPVGRGGGEERKIRREGNKERVLERESVCIFSLDFPTIGPSNPGEARGKVDLHCKGYAWVPGFLSFDNSER